MIITTAIIKGGTGKTTTSLALSQAAVSEGRHVLAVDMDPQGSLSYYLGGDAGKPGSWQVLQGHPAAGAVQSTPQGIDLIAGSQDLALASSSAGSAMRLKRAVKPLEWAYDLIIIDCAPHIGELLFNGIYAADMLLIPMTTDSLSIQGLSQIMEIGRRIAKNSSSSFTAGSILTMYDKRSKINRFYRDNVAEIGAKIGAPLIGTIRRGVAVQEAQLYQKSLYEYAPKSKPAQDYLDLFHKIMMGDANEEKL